MDWESYFCETISLARRYQVVIPEYTNSGIYWIPELNTPMDAVKYFQRELRAEAHQRSSNANPKALEEFTQILDEVNGLPPEFQEKFHRWAVVFEL